MSGRYPIDFMSKGITKSEEYFVYADVNRQAIELLLERFSENPPLHSHSLAPVVFLLRHYIELQLKGVIAFGEVSHTVKRSHNIQGLYKEAIRNVDKQYGIERLGAPSPEVEKFIAYLSNFDNGGEAFRYPETVNGMGFAELVERMDPWLYDTVSILDEFADMTKKVIADLERIEGYLHLMWENEQDKLANQ